MSEKITQENVADLQNQTSDYGDMLVEELKEHAKNRGITGYSSMKKDDLISALESSDVNVQQNADADAMLDADGEPNYPSEPETKAETNLQAPADAITSLVNQVSQPDGKIREDIESGANMTVQTTAVKGAIVYERIANERARVVKERLDAQPRVVMMLPMNGSEDEETAYHPVIINGYRVYVKKGVPVPVPQQIAEMLQDHLIQTKQAVSQMLISRNAKVQERLLG